MATNQAFNFDPNSNTLLGGLLVPGGGDVQIKGHTLSGIFDDKITSISLVEADGIIYKWEILVVGNAPPTRHFKFTDETNDTYSLSVISPVVENHEVSYNSKDPSIVMITW